VGRSGSCQKEKKTKKRTGINDKKGTVPRGYPRTVDMVKKERKKRGKKITGKTDYMKQEPGERKPVRKSLMEENCCLEGEKREKKKKGRGDNLVGEWAHN